MKTKAVLLAQGSQPFSDWLGATPTIRTPMMDIDPRTNGPVVDSSLSTSQRGVFAIGDLLHPNTDIATARKDGQFVAARIIEFLAEDTVLNRPAVEIQVESPLAWATPSLHRPQNSTSRSTQILVSTEKKIRFARIAASQNGRTFATRVLLKSAKPGRSIRVPHSLVAQANPNGGPITLSLHNALDADDDWTPNIMGEFIIPRAS